METVKTVLRYIPPILLSSSRARLISLCIFFLQILSFFPFNWGSLLLEGVGTLNLIGFLPLFLPWDSFDLWFVFYKEAKKKKSIMESKRQVGSSSSFTADLFGSKESSSSKGIFSSIFPPPSSVGGRSSSGSKVLESWPKQPLEGSAWRHAPLPNKEERVEPCHLSSSLYYGGQDLYSHSSSGQTSTTYPTIKKDGGEDDTNGNNSIDASRGNWWQGSLYY